MYLELLKYNNYFNRQVKRPTDDDYSAFELGTISVANFNFNDGVNTEQVINNWGIQNQTPDYCVLRHTDYSIHSRWYVLNTQYLRNGQYKLSLRRDLVVDFFNNIIESPAFIEKATPVAINDPAIFNKEDMSFNKIKVRERLLMDESNCAWIVGYIPRDADLEGKTIEATTTDAGAADITVETLTQYDYSDFINIRKSGVVDTNFAFLVKSAEFNNRALFVTQLFDTGIADIREVSQSAYDSALMSAGTKVVTGFSGARTLDSFGRELMNRVINTYGSEKEALNETFAAQVGLYSQSEILSAYDQNGKILYESDTDTYYRINVTLTFGSTARYEVPNLSALYQEMSRINTSGVTDIGAQSFAVQYKAATVFMTLSTLTGSVKTTLSNNRYHLEDSPYDMFAIPYAIPGTSVPIYQNGTRIIEKISSDAALNIATAMMPEIGTGNVYDLQMLPYCPVRYALQAGIDVGTAPVSYIKDSTEANVGVIFWARRATATFNIPISIPKGENVLQRKINSETKHYRLCSPNYSSASDFNAEMNGGVDYINVDMTYKPFTPYIHLNINYKELYGEDYNDSRGLILGGDFSLPQVTDAWANYELQNKNYQAIFDRQIENLETNNAVQRDKELINSIFGVVGAGSQGAAVGSIGGPIGSVAGSVIGAGLSAVGGVADRYYNEKLRAEGIDYTKDMYGYQLGNIKSLPQGIAKTSAITANSKYFPYIEYYECTETETAALTRKITYNGMTIMRIESVGYFLQTQETYIKGQLIRLNDFYEDYHIAVEIVSELKKGIFIKWT